jgi:hypothetical protein
MIRRPHRSHMREATSSDIVGIVDGEAADDRRVGSGAVGGQGTVVVEAPAPAVERSPSDVLRLGVAGGLLLALLAVQALFGDTLVTFAADVLRGLDALPSWIVHTLVVATRLLAIVILGGGMLVTVWRGRGRLLLTVLAAALLAVTLAAILDTFAPHAGGKIVELDNDAVGPLTAPGFPGALGIAVVSAVLTAAAPWLSRRWRRLGWVLVAGVTVTRFASSPISFDSFRNALVGWFAGAAVLVALGGPRRRPSGGALADGLAAVGVPLERLEQASVDARGSSPYFGTGADGQQLFVKALGEDQRSADLLFRLYRWLNRRDLGDERPFSSLTPRFVAFATARPSAFVLAYEAIEGRSLDRLQPDEVTDAVLAAIWEQVLRLREHRIAHRDLRLANVFLASDGAVWLIDFGFSELAASSLLLTTDIAELLASSTLQVGPTRAVAKARQAIGPLALGDALDRLRPWALSGATRAGLKERHGLLDELRREVGMAAGTDDRRSFGSNTTRPIW